MIKFDITSSPLLPNQWKTANGTIGYQSLVFKIVRSDTQAELYRGKNQLNSYVDFAEVGDVVIHRVGNNTADPSINTVTIKYVGGIWYFYLGTALTYTCTNASLNNLTSDVFLEFYAKGLDLVNIKYIELA